MKTVRVFFTPTAKASYDRLSDHANVSKIERSVFRSINEKTDLIKTNPMYGAPVSKKLIPKVYRDRYSVTNLYVVDLSNYWRMPYSLGQWFSGQESIALILELLDHREYDRKFGYRKK